MSWGLRFVAAVCVSIGSAALAGPLDPPAGPIEPTMKRLDQIEPRRCVNDLKGSPDAVFVIADPGNYYLSGDIQGDAGRCGIDIICPGDVSIELNGFSMTGVPGSLDAIRFVGGGGAGGRVSVRDYNWRAPSSIISSWGGCGIRCDGASELSVSGVSVRDCGEDGIRCSNSDYFVCYSVNVAACAGSGVSSSDCRGVVHRDVAVRNCLLSGIVRARSAPADFGELLISHFQTCVVSSCGGDGIRVECPDDGEQVTVSSSSSSSCGGHGMCVVMSPPGNGLPPGGSSFSFSSVSCPGNGVDGLHVSIPERSSSSWRCVDVTCNNNTGNGMAFRVFGPGDPHYGSVCYIGPCDASGNGESGLVSENPLYVEKGTFSSNALHGMRVSGDDPFSLMCTTVDCVLERNQSSSKVCGPGRYADVRCSVTEGGGDGIVLTDGCLLLEDCSITRCVGDGVSVSSGTLNVTGGNMRRNGGAGVRCSSGTCVAQGMVCEYNGSSSSSGGAVFIDCPSVTLDRCVFNENTGDGVSCSSSVGPVRWMSPECVSSGNSGDGFSLSSCVGPQLIACSALGNGDAGFRCDGTVSTGKLERCSATGNAVGFVVDGQGNLVVSCSSSTGPLGSFSIAPGNVSGPLVDSVGIATDCNPRANLVH